MNKSFKKIIACVASFALVVGIFAGQSTIRALSEKEFPTNLLIKTDSKLIQTRSVGTATVKKAIKWAIKHSDDVIISATKWIGKDAAKIVEKNFVQAIPVLKSLLNYDDLVWQTIQDQLTHVVGRDAAAWIRMALEWLL